MTVEAFVHTDEKLWFHKPFTLVDREGGVWNCACDRVWFLAIKGRGQHPRWPGEAPDLTTMMRFIHSPPEKPYKVKVEDLVSWVSTLPLGKDVVGTVLGVVVTAPRLKKLVETAPLKNVDMWKPAKAVGDERCLAFGVEDKWRAVLMGHDPKKVPSEIPAFDLIEDDSEEMSAFEMAMAMGADE